MINYELKQYFVDNKIQPVAIDVQSRSTKQVVTLIYFSHPIGGDEYSSLAKCIRGLFTSCALNLDTVLLIPTEALGLQINLLDAIEAASLHLEKKSNRRLKAEHKIDLSGIKAQKKEDLITAADKRRKERTKARIAKIVENVEAKGAAKKKAPAKKKAAAKRAPANPRTKAEATKRKAPAKRKAAAKKAPAKKKAAAKRKAPVKKPPKDS